MTEIFQSCQVWSLTFCCILCGQRGILPTIDNQDKDNDEENNNDDTWKSEWWHWSLLSLTKKRSVLFWWWYLLPHIVTIDLKSMSKRKMTKAVIVFPPLLMWWLGMWGKSIVLTKGGGIVLWYGSCMVVQKKTKAMVTNSPRLVIKPSKSWRINSSLSLRTKDFQLPHVWGWKCGRRLPD